MQENELVVVPKEELAEKDDLIKSAEEKCQKLKSDFARYKKRVADREEEVSGKVQGDLARQLLSVADSLDRALDSYNTNPDNDFAFVDNILARTKNNLELTYNQLLHSLGVTPIAPSAGERFNDELHTAIEATPNTFLPDKTVISLVRKGYTLNGELIRPAEVVISKGGEAGEEGKAKYTKSKGILSKFLRGFELRVFRRKYVELDKRERELSQNEAMLQKMAKELDARGVELKKQTEEVVKRRETEESRIHELEQNRDVLNIELGDIKKQLRTIREALTELETKKEKTVIEDIALNRYNKELLEEKEKVLKEIEELKRAKESLNRDRQEGTREDDLQMNEMAMCL